MGNALYSEYEDLLSRSDLWEECKLSTAEREQIFDALMSVSRWVDIYFLWRPNLPDEADNHLIELALASGSSHIVTYNIKDVAKGELLFPELKVVRPDNY